MDTTKLAELSQLSEPQLPVQKAEALVRMKAQAKELKEKIDQYTDELLKLTQEQDVLTLKTGSYTISRAKRITPQVTSFKDLRNSLEENNIPYDVKLVFDDHMTETFKKIIESGKTLDGLEAKETEYLSIRVTKK